MQMGSTIPLIVVYMILNPAFVTVTSDSKITNTVFLLDTTSFGTSVPESESLSGTAAVLFPSWIDKVSK